MTEAKLKQLAASIGDDILRAFDRRLDRQAEVLRAFVQGAIDAERERNRQTLAEVSRALTDLEARMPPRLRRVG